MLGILISSFFFVIYDKNKDKKKDKKIIHVVLSNLDSQRLNNHFLGLSIMYKQIRENKDSIRKNGTFIIKKLDTYWDTPLFSTAVIIDTAACMILIHNKNNIGYDYLLKNDTIYEVKLTPLELKIDTLYFKEYKKNYWKQDTSYYKGNLLPGPNRI